MGILQQSGDEQVVYQGKIIEVVKTPMSDGEKEITFEKARRAPGVRLIIHDTEKEQVLLTKEHRYELGADDFRLPGGKVVDTLEEFHELLKKDSVTAAAELKAKEEALEETGIITEKVMPYHVSVVGATVEWDLHYFVIEDFTLNDEGQQLEHGESISLQWLSYEEAQDKCLNGEMSEERSALVLLRWIRSLAS